MRWLGTNTVLQAQIKQMSLALEKQGNQINELADTINRVFNTTQDTAVRVDDIYSNTDAKNTGNIKQILRKTDEVVRKQHPHASTNQADEFGY